ncbi:FG-GAP-like repeat-containing protein [Uniformispora flossi]|uniref:FG-GAP-like repeat-containing protein n=1 Tax=Uniformispora flossi TaxID=3390723 RepID=UPI003D08BD79
MGGSALRRAGYAGALSLVVSLAAQFAAPAQAASLATWEKLAQCESSGDWQNHTGEFHGGLQFTHSTWIAYGGGAYASDAEFATKEQQIRIGEKVLAGQGEGAWPICGAKVGLGADHADPFPPARRTNDYNADGKADLISLNPDGSISVGTNFGDGWSGYQGVSSGWGPYTDRLDFADFDNDGKADLIALNPDGSISVGLNNGNGTGWSGYHSVSSGWGTYEGRLKFADLNDDGKADLIALNEDGSITVGINFGDGWSNYHNVSSGWGTYKGRLNFADLNGDGKADLIALNANGSLTVGINFGDGWSNYHGVSSGWGTYEDRLDFADLDGDGKADLIALNEDGSITVGINFGDGWSNYHSVSTGWGPYKGRINFA